LSGTKLLKYCHSLRRPPIPSLDAMCSAQLLIVSPQVQYETFLEDGTIPLENLRGRQIPLEFIVGSGQVVPGWDIAVPHLSVGTTAEVTIPPLFAYGVAGFPPQVPSDATLVYRITVLKVKKP
jgi:FKBP-type peptidyl-prolyl cis-trans isomerase